MGRTHARQRPWPGGGLQALVGKQDGRVGTLRCGSLSAAQGGEGILVIEVVRHLVASMGVRHAKGRRSSQVAEPLPIEMPTLESRVRMLVARCAGTRVRLGRGRLIDPQPYGAQAETAGLQTE